MTAISAPFQQIAEVSSPTGHTLLVAEFPAPAMSVLSPVLCNNIPGVDARRIALGLGPWRDSRVAHVAACWRYRNYETFETLFALIQLGGHLLVWHTAYGVGNEQRAEIKAAAQDALSVALVGETWPVIVRQLNFDSFDPNQWANDEEGYKNVEPITDTTVSAAVPRLRETLWAMRILYDLGRPTSLWSGGAWPKERWRYLSPG